MKKPVRRFARRLLRKFSPFLRYRNLSRRARRIIEHRWFRPAVTSSLIFTIFLVGSPLARGQAKAFSENDFKANVLTEEVILTTKQTSRLPVVGRLSQGFTYYHPGIDIENGFDSPIYPMLAGVIIETGFHYGGYGNYILIDHQNGFITLYAHLNRVRVKKDDTVSQDTVIGTVGMTGYATGSHLHLEVYENTRAINPLAVLPEDLVASASTYVKTAKGGGNVHPSRVLILPITQQMPIVTNSQLITTDSRKDSEKNGEHEQKPSLGILLPDALTTATQKQVLAPADSRESRQLPTPLQF